MRYLFKSFLSVSLVITVSGCFFSSSAQADVCSEGVGVPPFLSAGVDANLLLILDNSGSMLDMAYYDKRPEAGASATDEMVARECFDDSYMLDETTGVINETKIYAGYFDAEKWYVWDDTTTLPANITIWDKTWDETECYAGGELVWDNNKLYTAECMGANFDCLLSTSSTANDGCLPSGTNLTTDNLDTTGTSWAPYFNFFVWKKGMEYQADTFVKFNNQLFYTEYGGVENDEQPSVDGDVKWILVDHTWLPNYAYLDEDIVSYNGMIYMCNGGCNTADFDYAKWQRIEEGSFQEYTGGAVPCSDGYPITTGISTDLAIQIVDIEGDKIDTVADLVNAAAVSCFAAKGNFLNWATASKFDIQKKILTGGKFYQGFDDGDPDDFTDNTDDRLVGEHRGCSGSSYGKQVTLDATNNVQLTLNVRGSNEDDWLGTVDNTTRIEVVGVTVGGFDDTKCRNAVYVSENYGVIPGITQTDVQDALAQCTHGVDYKTLTSDAKEWQIYHSAVHTCIKGTYNKGNEISNFCEDVYRGENGFPQTYPWEIGPKDPLYICYGEYTDINWPHNDGIGYIGRLWKQWRTLGECSEKCSCDGSGSPDMSNVLPLGTGPWSGEEICTWKIDNQEHYTCDKGVLYNQKKITGVWTATPVFFDTENDQF